ncbi:hypothetical protein tb265_40910 [Gemmatimonadetes bacterium T265]|nr:hypothetical protein tb265_40910 [Gemmatimonadetes bacterium T265]
MRRASDTYARAAPSLVLTRALGGAADAPPPGLGALNDLTLDGWVALFNRVSAPPPADGSLGAPPPAAPRATNHRTIVAAILDLTPGSDSPAL